MRSVEVIWRVASHCPSLEAFENANSEAWLFFSRKGMNVGFYVAPTRTGYTIIWIDAENPKLTATLRAEVELIVENCLKGRMPNDESEAQAKEEVKGGTS